jgi:hypothetical protein
MCSTRCSPGWVIRPPTSPDVEALGAILSGLAAVISALIVARIPDEALITINGLEILGIIYLAIAVSKLREKIARLEGRYNRRRNGDDED